MVAEMFDTEIIETDPGSQELIDLRSRKIFCLESKMEDRKMEDHPLNTGGT